jgi:hypothetical protein
LLATASPALLACAIAADEAKWIALTLDGSSTPSRRPTASGSIPTRSKPTRRIRKAQCHGRQGSILVNGPKGRAIDLVTKEEFGDCELHLEFLIPRGRTPGEASGGLRDPDPRQLRQDEADGRRLRRHLPARNLLPVYKYPTRASPEGQRLQGPGEWQSLGIVWQSPRFDKEGKKTSNGKFVKVTLNGKVIHDNQEVESPTGHNWTRKETPRGPILLQGDHGRSHSVTWVRSR